MGPIASSSAGRLEDSTIEGGSASRGNRPRRDLDATSVDQIARSTSNAVDTARSMSAAEWAAESAAQPLIDQGRRQNAALHWYHRVAVTSFPLVTAMRVRGYRS